MKAVVYNSCFGGFGLSRDALYLLYTHNFPLTKTTASTSGWNKREFIYSAPGDVKAHKMYPILLVGDEVFSFDEDSAELRSHPVLVKIVAELGDKANGRCAKLKIDTIPDSAIYRIDEYDGKETVVVASKDDYTLGYLNNMIGSGVPNVKEIGWNEQ